MSKNLEERVQDVLDIAREPEWDKCVATMDNKFRDSTAKVPDS